MRGVRPFRMAGEETPQPLDLLTVEQRLRSLRQGQERTGGAQLFGQARQPPRGVQQRVAHRQRAGQPQRPRFLFPLKGKAEQCGLRRRGIACFPLVRLLQQGAELERQPEAGAPPACLPLQAGKAVLIAAVPFRGKREQKHQSFQRRAREFAEQAAHRAAGGERFAVEQAAEGRI